MQRATVGYLKENSLPFLAPIYWSNFALLGDQSPLSSSAVEHNPFRFVASMIFFLGTSLLAYR